MEIVEEFPPNYKEIIEVFPQVAESRIAIFAWDRTIYNPWKRKVTEELKFHESIHMRQQNGKPEEWWMWYLSNPEFRLNQEFEAYAEQYLFVCKIVPNNRIRKQVLFLICSAFSGEMYGNVVSFSEAEASIKRYAKSKLEEEEYQGKGV